MASPSAQLFVKRLTALSSATEAKKVRRFFRGNDDGTAADNKIMGVAFGKVFGLAKEFAAASLTEVDALLESPFYEVRLGAVSIMDFQARSRSTTVEHRKALFDLYLRRHNRINNWDLVDRAAPHVIGSYLATRPRKILYRLARSKNPWERRTAIVSTYFFIRTGDVSDTFGIAEVLVNDKHELVQKATGSWLREAGKKDRDRLLAFLEKYAATMPRTTLRYAVEKLEPRTRARFL